MLLTIYHSAAANHTIMGANAGSGDGRISYSVAAYTGKPKRRQGTMTVAGRTFTVTQSK